MERYRKLIGAVVGLGVMFLAGHGLNLVGMESLIVDAVISLGTAYSVYKLPNA